jgi:hypothetical protein
MVFSQAEQLHVTIFLYGFDTVVLIPFASVQFISTSVVDVVPGEQQRQLFLA